MCVCVFQAEEVCAEVDAQFITFDTHSTVPNDNVSLIMKLVTVVVLMSFFPTLRIVWCWRCHLLVH